MFDRVFQLQTHTHKDKHKDVQTQRRAKKGTNIKRYTKTYTPFPIWSIAGEYRGTECISLSYSCVSKYNIVRKHI